MAANACSFVSYFKKAQPVLLTKQINKISKEGSKLKTNLFSKKALGKNQISDRVKVFEIPLEKEKKLPLLVC